MTTDGNGVLALTTDHVDDCPGCEYKVLHLLSSGGASLGTAGGQRFPGALLPQQNGFEQGYGEIGSCGNSGPPGAQMALEALSERGALIATTSEPGNTGPFNWSSALDAAGGSLVAWPLMENTLCATGVRWTLFARRFDSHGAPRSAAAAVASGTLDAAPILSGVDLLGRSLLLWSGASQGFAANTLAGRWMSSTGAALTPVFVAATGISSGAVFFLRPLIGGGMALEMNGTWFRSFPSATAHGASAPGWLASRPRTKLEIIHGGTGYALLPFAGPNATACAQRVEILAPAGNHCGTVAYPIAAGSCSTPEIELGRDGTVIQRVPGSPCAYQWWPHSLQ